MALRWTRNDSLAYRDFSDLGQNLVGAYRQRQLGDAYKMEPEEVSDYDYNVGDTKRYKLGNEYSDAPYSPEQIDQARLKAAADVYGRTGMPEQGLKLRQMAKQGELSDVQLQGAKVGLEKTSRENRYGQKEEAFFKFMQEHQALPDEEFFPKAASFATQHIQDGKSFGVSFDPNEGWRGTVTNPDGTSSVVPIKSREGFSRALQRYVSPKMMQEAGKADREDEQLGLKRGELDVKRQQADTMERYRGDQAEHMRRQDDIMAQWRRDQAGLLRDKNARTTFDRMPEADKVFLTSLERQEQSLTTALGKSEDPTERAQIGVQLRQLRARQFDLYKKHKLIPEGTPRWQYLGMPDPMRMVIDAANNARNPEEYEQSLQQFTQLYGDDPDAADAFNAAEDLRRDKFGNRVKSQTPTQFGAPFSNAPRLGITPEQMRRALPYGLRSY